MSRTTGQPLPQASQPLKPFHLGYQPALDGLRGYAVLIVLGEHLKLPFVPYGPLGVDVFFTLSGFLITTLLCEEWHQYGVIRLSLFYMRRVLRLYPALLVMILVVSIIAPAWDYILSSLTYWTNWMIALRIRPMNIALGHTWSLAIEEQYYILWPPLFYFLIKRFSVKRIIAVLIGLALGSYALRVISWATLQDFWRYNAGTDTHADGLLLGSALGMATAFQMLPHSEKFQRGLRASTVVVLGMMGLATLLRPATEPFYAYVGMMGTVLTTLLVITQVVIFPVPILRRMLEFPLLVKIGVVSYGLYLWQVPVLVLFRLEASGIDPTLALWLKTILIFAIVAFSYRYIEKPVQKLKSRFTPKPVKRIVVAEI